MYPPLRAAKAEVDPGREDLKTLRENIGTLLERNPYRVEVEFDRKTGWHVAYARIVQEPEPDLAVLVGSAAYQFHSALNLIAWELAARKIGRKGRNQRCQARYRVPDIRATSGLPQSPHNPQGLW
jgi:hypothetical protein